MVFSDPTTANGMISWYFVSSYTFISFHLSSYLDLCIQGALLLIELIVVVWVHLQVVEGELLLDSLLECLALFKSERVGLGDDWNNVDNIGELLKNDNIDWLQGMAGWLDEEETAVDTGVLNVALSLCGELLAEVCGVLILDVLDDWVPASIIVDLVSVTWSIDDVEAEAYTILFDDV